MIKLYSFFWAHLSNKQFKHLYFLYLDIQSQKLSEDAYSHTSYSLKSGTTSKKRRYIKAEFVVRRSKSNDLKDVKDEEADRG